MYRYLTSKEINMAPLHITKNKEIQVKVKVFSTTKLAICFQTILFIEYALKGYSHAGVQINA